MSRRKTSKRIIKNLRRANKTNDRPRIGRFAELVSSAKSCVYIIARIRQDQLITLGTGFLASPNRLLSCDHVFNSDSQQHQDGDRYLLVQRDEFGWYHRFVVEPEKDKTLFSYPQKDTAILYLPEDFYVSGNKNRNHYLRLSRRIRPLGTAVGVLGYPLNTIGLNQDKSDIEMGSIVPRVDSGVLNTGYALPDGLVMNEFTMAFNPGNSGGPIIDFATGEVIAIVRAFNSRVLKFVKETVPPEQQQQLGTVEVVSPIRTLYSHGIVSTNLLDIALDHDIKM